MTSTAPRLERALLTASVSAAVAAFALAREASAAWVLLAPVVASLFIQVPRIPARAAAALRLLGRVALLATALLALFARQLPYMPENLGMEWGGVAGWVLACVVSLSLLARGAVIPGTTVLPLIVGLLVVAGLNPLAPHFLGAGTASAVLLWAWVAVSGGPRLTGTRVLSFLAAGAGVAAALILFLPWAQPRVEGAFASSFADGVTRLSSDSTLGDVESLARSERVVLRAWTDRPQRLRAWAFTTFDGRTWHASGVGAARELSLVTAEEMERARRLTDVPGAGFLAPGRGMQEATATRARETRILQSSIETWPLLVPARTVLVRAAVSGVSQSTSGVFEARGSAQLYGVVNDADAPLPAATAPGAGAGELSLPRLDPRTLELARRLGEGARTPRERLTRTVDHLRGAYRYSLDVGRFRSADPLAEFLFDKRAGYCEYFATAAALLLRAQGVPTRYVKGLSVGAQNRVGGHYVVREADAHAWIEAWIPGEGWVEADPTPPWDFARVHPPPRVSWLAARLEGAQAAAMAAWVRIRQGDWSGLLRRVASHLADRSLALVREPLVVASGLAVGAALVLRGLARRRRKRSRASAALAPVPVELRDLLRRMDRHWARAGRPRGPSVGLLEHLDRLSPNAVSDERLAASRRIVDAYYRAAFGGRPAEPGELAELERLWNS